MQTPHWQKSILSLLILGTFTFPLMAQDAELAAVRWEQSGASRRTGRGVGFQRGPGENRFGARLERTLGLTPEQRDAVRGLFMQQREKMTALRQETTPKYQAIREETDAKIRALLNPEQQKKFDALIVQQKESRARFQRKS